MDSDDNQDGIPQSPREYDFSADLNIKEVKDDGKDEAPAPAPNDPIFKSISEAVDKTLSASIKNPTQPAKPDPFREPINKLDTEWPFANPATIARHQDRTATPSQPAAASPQVPPRVSPRPAADGAVNIPPPPPNLPGAEPLDAPAQPVQSAQTVQPEQPAEPPFTPPPAPAATPLPRPIFQAPPQPPRPPVAPVPPPQQSAAPVAPTAPAAPAATDNERQIPGSGSHPGGLRPLRTYEGDVAEVLASRPVSRTSMAVAEAKKRGEGETLKNSSDDKGPAGAQVHSGIDLEEKPRWLFKIILVIVALAFLGGGAFGGYYLYKKSPLGTPVVPIQPAQSSTSLIPYDSRNAVSTDNATSQDLLVRIRSELKLAQAPNTIKEVVFTETKNGETYRVTAPEMILLTGMPVPDLIARTIQPEWMFGVYSSAEGSTTPFVMIHTNLFQNAFAGMLAWEQSMPVDLKPFFGIPDNTPAPAGSFKDRVVRNKDVRAFVGSDGTTLFEYSFLDDSTLAVAGNDAALSLIISRLESKAFVR